MRRLTIRTEDSSPPLFLALPGSNMTSSWTHGMQRASFLFATGSGFLLIAVLSYFWTNRWNDGSGWFTILSWFAVLVHGIGWVVLLSAILETGPEPRVQKMTSVFFVSLMMFVGGLLTLPVFFPDDPNAWSFFGPPWARVLLSGVFPHVPLVFGPVVVAHGVIFMLASSDFARPRSRPVAVAGCILLFWLAGLGIASQVLSFPQSFPAPLGPLSFAAGLTVLGYGLVAAGYRLERAPKAKRAVSLPAT